jgi:hypothetical protein
MSTGRQAQMAQVVAGRHEQVWLGADRHRWVWQGQVCATDTGKCDMSSVTHPGEHNVPIKHNYSDN